MAPCNACGADFRPGEPYCGKCGEQVSCLTCGQAYQKDERFCPSCGRAKATGFMSSGGDQTEVLGASRDTEHQQRKGDVGDVVAEKGDRLPDDDRGHVQTRPAAVAQCIQARLLESTHWRRC